MISLSLQHEPTVIMIFGASGDLTQRKVVPALYNLFWTTGCPRGSL